MTEQRKAVIKNADMLEGMQQDAVDIASLALSKYNIEKVGTCIVDCRFIKFCVSKRCVFCVFFFPFHCCQDVAAFIKKEFDKKYSPTW